MLNKKIYLYYIMEKSLDYERIIIDRFFYDMKKLMENKTALSNLKKMEKLGYNESIIERNLNDNGDVTVKLTKWKNGKLDTQECLIKKGEKKIPVVSYSGIPLLVFPNVKKDQL